MRTQKIYFPDQQAFCVFPEERSNLEQAVSELGFKDNYPVIVLIGGDIDDHFQDCGRHERCSHLRRNRYGGYG